MREYICNVRCVHVQASRVSGILLRSGLGSMLGLMARAGLCMARVCVYVYVCMYVCVYLCCGGRHSDILTRATTIRLHVEHDYMTGTKLCKMIPARYTYAPVVLRVAGRGVKENFCRKLKCVLC